VCLIFFVGTQLANHLLDQLRSSFSSQCLTHYSTMNSIEMDRFLADEVRLKHWDCTLMGKSLHSPVRQTQGVHNRS
jgi:hypothetical protein